MQPDPHAIQIRVDGSCFVEEGYKSGYAGFVAYPDDSAEQQIIFEGFHESNIYRMELAAIIAAMEWVREAQPAATRVQIFSDSLTVVQNISREPFWHKQKWRNAQGRPIEHDDLWRKFHAARKNTGMRVDFGWNKGKSTPLLKKVDKAAKLAAHTGTDVDRGYRPGKIGRPRNKGNATMFPAAGQATVIRVYRSRVVGKSKESKINFEMYDPATDTCGAKYFAYAQPHVGAQLHRQNAFLVQTNDNPQYPQIVSVLQEIPLPKARKKPASARSSSSAAAAGS
jgi:ribonuclease HI